jgi:glycerophosphoryl diester phosphodiesterase
VTALAIAHRAGNSLPALWAANALGADVIECDVHEYRGRLEVRHFKTAGPLPFLWDRWELASAYTPRLNLDALLEAGRDGPTLMLDLKGRRISTARSVAHLLHERHNRPVLACGRHWSLVDELSWLPFVRPVLSVRNRAELARLRRRLPSDPAAYGVSLHRSLLDDALVADLHDYVHVVMTWPVNTIAQLEDVMAMGVSGVISDRTEVLAALVSRRRD